jgi:TPR repeat protein
MLTRSVVSCGVLTLLLLAPSVGAVDLEELKRACKAGKAEDCYLLGGVYRGGIGGIAKDLNLARQYFEEACNAGSGKGCAALGRMYLLGSGLIRDDQRGHVLLARACRLGDASSCADASPAPPASRSLKPMIWALGHNLAFAGLLNTMTDKPNAARLRDDAFAKAQTIGRALDLPIAVLPAATGQERNSASMDYLLRGPVQEIAREIKTRYGTDHAALFELALHTDLLMTLYIPGDDYARSLKTAILQLGPASGLPPSLWTPLAAKIDAAAPRAEVTAAAKAMTEGVASYLENPSAVAAAPPPPTPAPALAAPGGDAQRLADDSRRLAARVASLESELRAQSSVLSPEALARKQKEIARTRTDLATAIANLKTVCADQNAPACDVLHELH